MKRMLAFLMLLLFFNPLNAFSDIEAIPLETPQKKQKASATGAQISITVSLTSENGKSAPVQDMELFFCPESAKAEIAQFRATGKILAKQTGDFNALTNDLNFMTNKANSLKIASVRTNSRGTCTINGVQKGSYCLYAGYKNDASAGYWVVPLTSANKKKIAIKLDNKNITELIHK